MMSNEVNERLKRDTQHVPLKVEHGGKSTREGSKSVWDDTNESSAEEG